MYGVNNSVNVPNAYTNYGKNAQAQSPQEQQKTTAAKKAMRADEILFTDVYQADKTAVDALGLSDDAKNLLLELKEKYKGYDFMVGDYQTSEQASRILNGGKGTVMNVLITPSLLEEMAADKSVRTKYENIIAGAADQFAEVKTKLTESGKYYLGSMGLTVNEDGSCDYYAFLKNGLTTEDGKSFLQSSSANGLADMLNALAENRSKVEEKEDVSKTEKTDNTAEVDDGLSDGARAVLNELMNKYKDYGFIVGNWETDEQASEMLSHGLGTEGNVLISPALLERMAADESVKAQYIGIIDDAANSFKQAETDLTEDGKSIVEKMGMTVDGDGNVSFFASLIDGVKTDDGGDFIQSSLVKDLVNSLNTLAQARQKAIESGGKEEEFPPTLDSPEEKEEKVEKSVMPPKSFEKYQKEETPYSTEEDYGTLPPESFEKYKKEESPYSTEEDYGTLPPESFKKYQEEVNAINAEEAGEAMNYKV